MLTMSVRPRLLHERISQPELVGASRGHKLLECGKLGFPTELADSPIRQDTRLARSDAPQIAQQLVPNHAQRSGSILMENGPARQAIDPAGSEQSRGVDAFGSHGVKVADFDQAASHDLQTPGHHLKEI